MIIGRLRVWLRRHKVTRTGALMGPRGATWHAPARELRCVPHVTPPPLSPHDYFNFNPSLPFMDAPQPQPLPTTTTNQFCLLTKAFSSILLSKSSFGGAKLLIFCKINVNFSRSLIFIDDFYFFILKYL